MGMYIKRKQRKRRKNNFAAGNFRKTSIRKARWRTTGNMWQREGSKQTQVKIQEMWKDISKSKIASHRKACSSGERRRGRRCAMRQRAAEGRGREGCQMQSGTTEPGRSLATNVWRPSLRTTWPHQPITPLLHVGGLDLQVAKWRQHNMGVRYTTITT